MSPKTINTTRKSSLKRLALSIVLSVVFCLLALTDTTAILLPNVLITTLICFALFYANIFFVMPRILFRGQFVLYAVIGIGGLVVVGLIMWALAPVMTTAGVSVQYFCRWELAAVVSLLTSTVYGYSSLDRLSRKREIDLTHQNIEFEMKFLKSQINPHFLFNALNNIYALSVIKSDRTPDMILKLSDMLRFTLYDSESQKVKIGREIDYIENYIEFQKLKMDSEPNIHVDTSNCNKEMLIEPMLMIPFIENSFKHGNIDNSKKGWLQVEIKTLGPILIFKAKNSLPAIAINKDIVGGIGVENVRKRLDILYPERYELNIETTDSAFSIYMKIDTFAG